MVIEPNYKKPGDLIRSEEWNKILDELVDLRGYIENMTRSVTLTSLQSPVGKSYGLGRDAGDDFNYGMDVMGLITRQYFLGKSEIGDLCQFGLHDRADVISYWSGAANGDREALEIAVEYTDGNKFKTGLLFIHEWSNLRPKGNKNPFIEYLQSTNQHFWYRYSLVNPSPEKEIRYVTFKDMNPDCAVRIANVMHYTARVKPLASR